MQIVGVDLVDAFSRIPPAVGHMVRFEVGSVLRWEPDEADFDLVTCVHGLHYVGDKLGAIARAASWLRPQTGLFQANFDLKSVLVGGKAGTLASRWLRRHGFHVDPRKRVISARGRREVSVPWAYSGADDRAGPNYTGQPAVNSHYAELQ